MEVMFVSYSTALMKTHKYGGSYNVIHVNAQSFSIKGFITIMFSALMTVSLHLRTFYALSHLSNIEYLYYQTLTIG